MAPKKKGQKNVNVDDAISSAFDKFLFTEYNKQGASEGTGLVDVLTFCDKWLNVKLAKSPYLKLLLKMFYVGTIGNESLTIDDEDIKTILEIDNYQRELYNYEGDEPNGNPWLYDKAIKVQQGDIDKPFQYLVLALGRRSGKSQRLDSKLLTPTGWKRMGDIAVGDKVISVDGKPTNVTAIYPQDAQDVYRVTMSDGSYTDCCGNHLWFTTTRQERRKGIDGSVKNTIEIKNSLFIDRRDNKKERNHKIPLTAPVEFEPQNVPLDPYLLGALLGDGGMSANFVSVTTKDEFILEQIRNLLPDNVKIVQKSGNNGIDYGLIKNSGYRNPLITALRNLNLIGNTSSSKFIPDNYKFNDIETRIAVLQGLLDTDGTVDKRHGKVSFCTVSEKLAKDVQFLVQSLGGVASVNPKTKTFTYNGEKKTGKTAFELQIKLPTSIQPFRLPRKADVYNEFLPNMREPYRMIESVELISHEPTQCISVDHPTHLYVTDDFIVTHNTFTTSIILSYEVYKLLEMVVCPECNGDIKNVLDGEPCPDCGTTCVNHPQAYYGVLDSEPLRILMCATTKAQAMDPGFNFFCERITNCPYFDGRIFPGGREKMTFLTRTDMRRNARLVEQGLEPREGSILVKPISSNAGGAHGTGSVMILFDEFALFNRTGPDSDNAIMEALRPQTLAYRHRNDGRMLMISMPTSEDGQFYEHFQIGKDTSHKYYKNMLSMQMPTWEFAASRYTREMCEELALTESKEEGITFERMYGAQFSKDSEETFIPASTIDRCFDELDMVMKSKKPVHSAANHFMHIDCAMNTANYAFVVLHPERRQNPNTGKLEVVYVQDASNFWVPNPKMLDTFIDSETGKVVGINEILASLVQKARDFRATLVSYDNMQSLESVTFFKKHNLNLKRLSFGGGKEAEIYGLLRSLMYENRIICCSDDWQLRKELKSLRSRYTSHGFKIKSDTTSDVSDCLAGAVYMASTHTVASLPRSISVNTGGLSAYGRGPGGPFGGPKGPSGSIRPKIR